MSDLGIRPFRDGDRAAIVALRNARKPAHLQETVAEWEREDALRSTEEVSLRLCAGEPAVAYLSATDQGTSPWRKPGVCWFGLWVAKGHQRQGVGGALFEKMVEFARGRGLDRAMVYVRLFEPDEPAPRFLEKRGFTEVDRDVPVKLDLTTFDPSLLVPPAPEGIKLLSLAEAGDTEDNRRKVWALDGKVIRDIPTHDVMPEHPPFEEWVKHFQSPECDPRAIILAEDAGSGEWVGLSTLAFQEHTNVAWTPITGVLPAYRGRGVALALKLRTIDAALARGCPLITTENHEDNAPMRAVNRKLGFVPDAPGVSYSKTLSETL